MNQSEQDAANGYFEVIGIQDDPDRSVVVVVEAENKEEAARVAEERYGIVAERVRAISEERARLSGMRPRVIGQKAGASGVRGKMAFDELAEEDERWYTDTELTLIKPLATMVTAAAMIIAAWIGVMATAADGNWFEKLVVVVNVVVSCGASLLICILVHGQVRGRGISRRILHVLEEQRKRSDGAAGGASEANEEHGHGE